jgi:hypothetical protein
MSNMTNEMQQARWDLQILSASDPAASANMMRHVCALGMMLTGGKGRPRLETEPAIQAGFQLAPGEQMLQMAVTSRTGVEQIYLAFDIDDAAGPPVGLGIIRSEGEQVVTYGKCQLWSPSNVGRAVIVPGLSGEHGHFTFRRGAPLRHVRGLPPGDLRAGCLRGLARMKRLLESPELRDVHRDGVVCVIHNESRELFADTMPVAA